jgi:hypothetical protein
MPASSVACLVARSAGEDDGVTASDSVAGQWIGGKSMKTLLLSASMVLCILLCGFCACSDDRTDAEPDTTEWTSYRNEEYGYEIRYPAGFDFHLTGSEDERDGREFQISREMVYGPCLHCNVYPGLSAEDIYRDRWEITSGMIPGIVSTIQNSAKDSLTWRYEITKLTMADKEVLVEGARWVPSGTLTGRSLFFDGVVFVYSPGGFGPEDEGPMSWPTALEIVSNFRFLGTAEPHNQD